MKAIYRWLMKWTRTLHIYLSMFALMALFFFAATGFMLNHPGWFGFDEARRTAVEGDLPPELVAESFDKLKLVEHLRANHSANGLVDPFEADDEPLRIIFRSPGRMLDVTIDRETGHFQGETETSGLAGRLTDLHKGKSAGNHWSVVIDGVSILLLFISLTGLILWISLRKRLIVGVVAALAGIAVFAVVYFIFVP